MDADAISGGTVREQRRARAAEWVFRLRDPRISPEEIRDWMAWCEASEDNRLEFEHMRELWRQTAGIAAPVQAPGRDASSPWRWALAATLAAVTAGAGAWLLAGGLGDRTDVAVTTTRGVHREVMLPDRSMVTVAGASRVVTHYTGNERRVLLERGEAFFRVEKEPGRPFIVQALDATVTAIGTAFTVRAEDGVVKVVVTEGTVDVDRRHGMQENIRLTAGHQVTLAGDETAPRVLTVDPGQATAWLTGTLRFEREPLSSVLAAVNRYAAAPITLADAELGALNYTGTVVPERVAEWLSALPDIYPVRVRAAGGRGVIIEAAR